MILLVPISLLILIASGTFLKHLHPQERTIDRYIQYFIGLVNGADESVELFMEQKRASPELKRLLAKRQREMQERRRLNRNIAPNMYSGGMPPGMRNQPSYAQEPQQQHSQVFIGDAQWNLVPERGDLEELRELVGDRLLKCLSHDSSMPRDVRDSVGRFTSTPPELRRRGDLEDLGMEDPRRASRSNAKGCLVRFEADLLAFLKQLAEPDGEQYLLRLQRLLRTAGSHMLPRRYQTDEYGQDEYDDEDDSESGLPWWAILLIILIVLAVLAAIGYGLYWFFRWRRLERRIIIGAAAGATSAAVSGVADEAGITG